MKTLIGLLIAVLGMFGIMIYTAADEYFAPYRFVTIDGGEMEGTHCMSRDHAFTCDSYDGKRFLVKEFERLK